MDVLKHVESMMTEDEIKESDREYELIKASLDSLNKSVSLEIKNILKSKNISLNSLGKKLKISKRTLSKLSQGKGNVTLETIALLTQVSGKKPKIIWVDSEDACLEESDKNKAVN